MLFMLGLLTGMVERGWVPDALVRTGIRRLCSQRLRDEGLNAQRDPLHARHFVQRLSAGPVAPVPEKANEQHYELPPAFFRHVLGPRLKYSGCLFPSPGATLAEAEDAALAQITERAQLANGMEILELGCGWGSWTLWMAERFPDARITAVSNSRSQRRFIEERARERDLANLRVITADMNEFEAPGRYDRVVSVEMFEHMANYCELLRRIAAWLRPDGRLFIHIFCHARLPYAFETEGSGNWMGRHFFTGGLMPSEHLLDHFDEHLRVVTRWQVDGMHYQRTAEAWLANLDRGRAQVLPILAEVYGAGAAQRWLQRWRVFFLACAELFGAHAGREWFVSHQLLAPTASIETPTTPALTGVVG